MASPRRPGREQWSKSRSAGVVYHAATDSEETREHSRHQADRHGQYERLSAHRSGRTTGKRPVMALRSSWRSPVNSDFRATSSQIRSMTSGQRR